MTSNYVVRVVGNPSTNDMRDIFVAKLFSMKEGIDSPLNNIYSELIDDPERMQETLRKIVDGVASSIGKNGVATLISYFTPGRGV